MKQIRQGKIRTLAAMCEALAEQPLQNEPGWNTLWQTHIAMEDYKISIFTR